MQKYQILREANSPITEDQIRPLDPRCRVVQFNAPLSEADFLKLGATLGTNRGEIASRSEVWLLMRSNFHLVLGIVLLSTGGCAALHSQSDAMCAEISKFANSSTDTSIHNVALINDWGGPISQEESQKQGDYAMYVKQCMHDDYSPGKDLCAHFDGEYLDRISRYKCTSRSSVSK